MSSRTLLARFLLSVALLVTAGGCSLLGEDGPSAEDAASDVADALNAGRLPGALFAGGEDPQTWWDDLVAGLDEAEYEVTVVEVTENEEDGATALLEHRWRLPQSPEWSYRTTARLMRDEERWTVVAEPTLVAPDLREGERLVLSRELPPRAEVLGSGGARLVTERSVVRYGIDKTRVTAAAQQQTSARALARLLDIDVASYVDKVRGAAPKAFVQALVLRTADATPSVGAAVEGIEGAVGLEDRMPLAPTRDFARAILGTVGPVTAEVVEESNGFYRAGDESGLSGLQLRYDEQLRGTPGALVEAVDEEGKGRALFETDPQPGEPLRLTLDAPLQVEAERLLAEVMPASAVVAIKPSTGEVLAAASGPGGEGLSTATVGQYAPGSTMKVVTSLALIRAGLGPDSPLTCPAATTVDGKQFKNYSDYPSGQLGRIDLFRAVAHSCNTAFIGARDSVSADDLGEVAAALGLGVDHDLGYPVFLGSVPREAGSETEHAASLIGQGRVLASPVAMATVAASVASGRTVVPRLVPDQVDVEAAPAEPLTGQEAQQLRALMRSVVAEGSGTFLGDLPGPPVLAKTGTAEFGDREPPATHAWMIAVQGDLAVAAFVATGKSGSRTAGPLLEAFLRLAG